MKLTVPFVSSMLIMLSLQAQESERIVFESIGFDRYAYPLTKVSTGGKQYYYHLGSGVMADETGNRAAGMTVVMKDGRYGVIREDGELIVPFAYDEVTLENDYNGQWHEGILYNYKFVMLRKDGRYGLADEDGRVIVPMQYASLEVISKHAVAFKEGGRWGWLSPVNGEIIQPPLYDNVRRSLAEAFVEVEKDGKRGLASVDGTLIVPVEQNGYLRYIFSKNDCFVLSTKTGDTTATLYDLQGNIRLTGVTKLGSMRHADFITFEKDGHIGAVNPMTGETVIEPVYDRIEDGVRDRFKVMKGNLYGVLDEKGNTVVPVSFSRVDFIDPDNRTKASLMPTLDSGLKPMPQDEHQAALRRYQDFMDSQSYFIRVQHDEGTGLFDWEGTMLASPENYDAIQLTFHKRPYIVARNKANGHIAILDDTGKKLDELPYELDRTYQYNAQKIALDWELGNRYVAFMKPVPEDQMVAHICLYDLETATMAVPLRQQRVKWLDDMYFVVRTAGDEEPKTELYTRDGKRMLSYGAPVNNIVVLGPRHVLLVTDDAYRLADTNGNILYENPEWGPRQWWDMQLFPEYGDWPSDIFHHGLLKIELPEETLFVNEQGEEIRFDGYERVDAFYTGIALTAVEVTDDTHYNGFAYRYGLIDADGNEIRSMEWESVHDFGDNPEWMLVAKDGKWGVADRQGNYILEPVYGHISTPGSRASVEITKDGKAGLAALDGTIILEPRYDRFHYDSESKEGIWPLIAKEGEWYYAFDETGRKTPIRARKYGN